VRFIPKVVALAFALSLWCAAAASAATLHLVGDFIQPIYVTSDPGNPDRLFVVEREGRVVEADGGKVTTFADLTPFVSCCESERGLLSIALAPDFDSTGRLFAAYTGTPAAGGDEGDIHVDAFRRVGGMLQREPLFQVGHAVNANHNGGQVQFGPDGYLYVSTGDGGGGGDPFGSGQDLASLLGKILRVEPRSGAQPQVWSYGLRNPWRFSFDRATGDMVIGDVGQKVREEVDLARSPGPGVVGGAGANYGWNCREGFIPYSGAPGSCAGAGGFTEPVFDYPHEDPGGDRPHGCAITGGYVARDPGLGDLYGRYLYADFCVGEIRSLALPATTGGLATGDRSEGVDVSSPNSFGEDSCGRLYVVSNDGPVYRLQGASAGACPSAPPGMGTAVPIAAAKRQRPQVVLRVRKRRVGGQLKLIFTVRVEPCAEHTGERVRLQRDGRGVGSRRLNQHCVAHFHLRIARRSTFRAILPADGYRSQVRTIALAKPRP
jgi:hypothetical protein